MPYDVSGLSPKYNQAHDKTMMKVAINLEIIRLACKNIKQELHEVIDTNWWYYEGNRHIARKTYDALSLLDHDLYLLLEQMSRVSEKIWKQYYKEHPEQSGQDIISIYTGADMVEDFQEIIDLIGGYRG